MYFRPDRYIRKHLQHTSIYIQPATQNSSSIYIKTFGRGPYISRAGAGTIKSDSPSTIDRSDDGCLELVLDYIMYVRKPNAYRISKPNPLRMETKPSAYGN